MILANQLVGRRNLEIVAETLRDPGFELLCLVDSAEGVDALGEFLLGERIDVLVEIGASGGRAGVRDEAGRAALLAALDRWRGTVRLRGVELFEGVLTDEPGVRAFLARAVEEARRLVAEGRLEGPSFVLSGAGSAWFDVVAEVFTGAEFAIPAQVVLRPGCTLTHDIGIYREPAERMREGNAVVRGLGAGLLPALQVWAYVQSLPEAGVAVVGMGKRDVSFDAGFPTPTWRHRPGDPAPRAAGPNWVVERMMDQHAMLRVGPDHGLRVGDMIGFDVSHPCLTFDRWRHLFVLDDGFDVIDTVETFFRPTTV